MEVAKCISLFPQFFLTSLHLHQSATSSFLKPTFLIFPPFNPWLDLFTFSKYFMFHCLHQNIFIRLSQNMTIPPHTIRPCQLICSFLQSQHVHQLHCIFLVQLYTEHHPHHGSFCSSQNSYFIFSQTSHFASI